MDKKFNCALLIDDDGTTNFINYRIVKKLNVADQIQTEINGEKALNFLQFYAENHDNNAPELIIVDLKMPILNGFEFLQYLNIKRFANKENIKIIVLTTSMYAEDLKQLRKFNAEYLTKPLTEGKLNSILNE
jgi:response regulator of citrate/malate metabolism